MCQSYWNCDTRIQSCKNFKDFLRICTSSKRPRRKVPTYPCYFEKLVCGSWGITATTGMQQQRKLWLGSAEWMAINHKWIPVLILSFTANTISWLICDTAHSDHLRTLAPYSSSMKKMTFRTWFWKISSAAPNLFKNTHKMALRGRAPKTRALK